MNGKQNTSYVRISVESVAGNSPSTVEFSSSVHSNANQNTVHEIYEYISTLQSYIQMALNLNSFNGH